MTNISGSPAPKRKKQSRGLTPAERKARSRANQSAEQKEEAKLKQAAGMRKSRESQSVEHKEKVKAKESAARKGLRAEQSVEQREAVTTKNTAARKKARAEQPKEKKDRIQAMDTAAKKEKRLNQKTLVEKKEALRTLNILQGSYEVKDLKDTGDSIGMMDHVCEECGALKFKKETSSTCCGNGKVIMPRFPTPPTEIHRLWRDNTAEGRLFWQNARSLNNAVCLTSLK